MYIYILGLRVWLWLRALSTTPRKDVQTGLISNIQALYNFHLTSFLSFGIYILETGYKCNGTN